MLSAIPTKRRLHLFLKNLFLSLASVILFFSLLEGLLYLSGVKPEMSTEDPFFGFASNVPLFIEKVDSSGKKIMVTARNKQRFFNSQKFPVEKAPGTRRIFCVGGSTTFGRPYNDTTSFAGWLRQLLPAADPQQHWEVINAGGISYASYRVAQLMQELVRYQPDLFIIYTGHNEFLEERSYGALRDIPSPIKKAAVLLARTHIWVTMKSALDRLGVLSHTKIQDRVQLNTEVNALLDRSAGPNVYHRDETLREQILMHYRISLERMADIARSAGAEVVFVTPASNLRDSSPFKSEHTEGLDKTAEGRSAALLANARELIRQSEWSQSVELLDQALAIDPEYAELHYQRGSSLMALGRYEEADKALVRARDEDICPLRALSPMQGIVTEVAREKDAMLADYIDLLEQRVLVEQGYHNPGEDYFLDHVHPTIEGNRILAVSLIEVLAEQGMVHKVKSWGEEAVDRIAAQVEGSLDKKEHAKALANLAKVLLWAGKNEDASRLANKALSSGIDEPNLVADVALLIAMAAEDREDFINAWKYYGMALRAKPDLPETHFKVGLLYLNQRNFEKAAAHILLASAYWPGFDYIHQSFGVAIFKHGRPELAYPSLLKAMRLNPSNKVAEPLLAKIRHSLATEAQNNTLPKVDVYIYSSGAPQKVVQRMLDRSGHAINHGILTEWHENGTLKRFIDYANGEKEGIEMIWNEGGQLLSKDRFRQGVRIMPSNDNFLESG